MNEKKLKENEKNTVKNSHVNSNQISGINLNLSDMTPNLESIIAFVNPKSGGQKGRVILERLKKYLHSGNVFDLTNEGPKSG